MRVGLLPIFLLQLILFVQFTHGLKGKSPDEAPGVVLLDSITFSKVIPNHYAHALVLIYDKGQIGDPTTDGSRDNFLEVAREKDVDDSGLLFAQVLVSGAHNAKLVERLGVHKMPQLLLFPKGSSESIPFPDNTYINGVNTRRFVTKYTGTIYKTPSGLVDLDYKALDFMKSSSNDERENVFRETQDIVQEKYSDEEASKTIADEYLRVMQKVNEEGINFVVEEIERLTSLLKSKISDKKRRDFYSRRNILYHFDFSLGTFAADGSTSDAISAEL